MHPCRIGGVTQTTGTPLWAVDDYAPAGIIYSGALKLADSAVAPLVAQARGYRTVTDEVGAKEVANLCYVSTGQRTVTERLKKMTVGGNDFTYMPWFGLSALTMHGIEAADDMVQVRPSRPLPDRNGKTRKYEFLAGHEARIDLHPAVPVEWVNTLPKLLISEGIPKGDAALTAQLLSAGVSAAELVAQEGLSAIEARRKVQTLLERIPKGDRIPVLSLAGVANWHNNPDWNSLTLRDRRVLVAFDGDVHENYQVWNQASKMFQFLSESKKATPAYLDLGGLTAKQFMLNAGYESSEKLGLDDFLSHVGTWEDALKLVEPTLPAAPKNEDDEDEGVRPGDWRINPDGVSADRYIEVGGALDRTRKWDRNVVSIGGRIKSISTLRTVHDTNVASGYQAVIADSDKSEVVYELSWVDEKGQTRTGLVKGSGRLQSELPQNWARIEANIDQDLASHPDWPVMGIPDGKGWLSAIKRHRRSDIERHEGWDTMGWVPTTSGYPVFIVGNSVLGRDQETEEANQPGVDDDALGKASLYGVNDTYPSYTRDGADRLDDYRAQVAQDVLKVLEAFTDGTAFRRPEVGPILLACALRPACPTQTVIQLFLSGAPGSGKSWTASFLMGFWQSRGGAWTETNLPGSAMDTAAAIEYARARTPIWVIDDLAPGSSRQESERQEVAVDSTIRSGFNGAGKRRSSAAGKQQRQDNPRALTVYTGENQRDTLSIRQRSVDIRFERGDVKDGGAQRIADMTKGHENVLSRLTAAMVRFWINTPIEDTVITDVRLIDHDDLDLDSWEGKHQLATRIIRRTQEDIQEVLQLNYNIGPSESARRAKVFSEVLFTLDTLYALARWAGVDRKHPLIKQLEGEVSEANKIPGALVAYAAENLEEFRTQSNGRRLTKAIRLILESGDAHLLNPVNQNERPIPSSHPHSDEINRALGWRLDPRSDVWVTSGKPIGFVGFPEGSTPTQWVALLEPTAAFSLAQRTHQDLVPFGQKAGASWDQVWTDEDGAMVDKRYSREVINGKGQTRNTVRIRFGGGSRLAGVPVKLSALLMSGEDLLETNEEQGPQPNT